MVNYFFKVVLHEALRDGKLKIPPKFVRTNGKSVEGSKVVLEARVDGEEWEVNLEKHGGKVWLGEGWKEFSNHYSIKLGHILVFKYKENSGHFRVHMFDETATEMEFHSTNRRTRRKGTTEQPPLAVGKRKQTTHTAAGTYKGTADETPMPSKATLTAAGTSTGTTDVETPMPSKGHNEKMISKRYAGDRAVKRAEDFKSRNPFFRMIIRQTYAYGRYMNIPNDFVKNHLEDKSIDVIFRNSEGRTWKVRYLYGTLQGKTNGKFTGRSSKFVEDNNVEVGDVCVFELINCHHHVCFKVHIFKSDRSSSD